MIDHLVLFTTRDEASPEDVVDLLTSLRALRDKIPSVVDLSAGENFSERAGGYTHGLFARFENREGLREYIEHPDHLAGVEKLDALTTGRIVLDYET